MTNQIIEEKAVEYAERATIVYANYTGRDEEHRSEFRAEMLKLFRTVLHQADQAGYARGMGEADKIVREEMDKTEHETPAEFIACDELVINIIKRLTPTDK